MRRSEAQALIDRYSAWLKNRTELREVNGWVEVTTPYLDRHNDHLQIYVTKDATGYVLSDDGYIISDLAQSGFQFGTGKRSALLRESLTSFGVTLDEQGALKVHATDESFPMMKHNLVQAMLTINDMFNLSEPNVLNLFVEDVARWLDDIDARYSPKVLFKGKSGFDHTFDFLIPKSRAKPERVLKVIPNPTKQSAGNTAFAWMDAKETRPEQAQLYAFLNDEKQIAPGVVEALTSYEITPVPWSRRESVRPALTA